MSPKNIQDSVSQVRASVHHRRLRVSICWACQKLKQKSKNNNPWKSHEMGTDGETENSVGFRVGVANYTTVKTP